MTTLPASVWADIRDLAERVLDDGGVSSNYPAEAAREARDRLWNMALLDEADTDEWRMGMWVYASLNGEAVGCCDWNHVARICEGIRRGIGRPAWESEYDPKAEGARKLAEG